MMFPCLLYQFCASKVSLRLIRVCAFTMYEHAHVLVASHRVFMRSPCASHVYGLFLNCAFTMCTYGCTKFVLWHMHMRWLSLIVVFYRTYTHVYRLCLAVHLVPHASMYRLCLMVQSPYTWTCSGYLACLDCVAHRTHACIHV